MAGPMNNWQFQGYGQPTQNQGVGGPPTQQPYPSNNFQPIPQPQPMIQPAPFVGRFIENLQEIVPNEVPMDGRPALFPAKSLEEIYLKMWNANGEMKTFRYVLDQSQNFNAPPPPKDDFQSEIMKRLESLEQKIAENNTKNNGRKNSPKGGEE